MQKILIIQTAFVGDVVLATAMIEKLYNSFPSAQLDILVRKGNEKLLTNNLKISNILIWDKKEDKIAHLFGILKSIRKTKYDKVINLQRFFSTGFLTAFSKGKQTIGFDKNPLSFLFSTKVKHSLDKGIHEVERNNELIASFTNDTFFKPKLYPSAEDVELVKKYKDQPYFTITPSSVWFTKQYPLQKWIVFIDSLPGEYKIYLLGGPENIEDADFILKGTINNSGVNLAGKLGFLQSAALMKDAQMNYANDSAPLHFASAVNAPVTAIFCSTIPAFGFTPLSDRSFIVETKEVLNCRPCGIHGRSACPLGHFKCALTIHTDQLINTLNDA